MLYYVFLNGIDWYRVCILIFFGIDQHVTYFDISNAYQKLSDDPVILNKELAWRKEVIF